jgi:hypothetical protein
MTPAAKQAREALEELMSIGRGKVLYAEDWEDALAQAKAAIAALDAEGASTEWAWQSIETALKDGRQILGRVDYTDQTWTVVYFGGFHPNSPGKHVWRDAFSKRPVQSFEAWMPLPPAPSVNAKGDK